MSDLLKWKKASPVSIEHHIQPFVGFHRSVNDALNDFYNLFESTGLEKNRFEKLNLLPALDIVEADDHYNVEAEMPGMGEDDIKVCIDGNRLTIQGEKSTSKKHKDKKYVSREINYGKYERTVVLPSSADTDKASASFKKGMLWVTIPKKTEKKKSPRAIHVKKV